MFPLVFPMAGVRLLSSLILRPSTWPKGLHGHLGHQKTGGKSGHKRREKRYGKSMRNQGTQTGSTRKFWKFRFRGFWWILWLRKIWTFHQQNRNRDNLDLTHTCDLIHNDTSNIDMISICNKWDMMGMWLMNWLVVAGIFHVHLIFILPSMMVLIEYFLRIGRTKMGCNKYTRTMHTYGFIHHIYIYIHTLYTACFTYHIYMIYR